MITGYTIRDNAGWVLDNLLGWYDLSGHNVIATIQTMFEVLYDEFSYTSNPDELIRAIFEFCPELNTEDNYTRTLKQMGTDRCFGSVGCWEANIRTRYRYSAIYHLLFPH